MACSDAKETDVHHEAVPSRYSICIPDQGLRELAATTAAAKRRPDFAFRLVWCGSSNAEVCRLRAFIEVYGQGWVTATASRRQLPRCR